jgi:hypothetical protein
LLPIGDASRNFLDKPRILAAVRQRFASHKAGDLNRALTNTAASQGLCFNLFVPLAENLRLASEFLGVLLGRNVAVAHIELEFTPNSLISLPGYELLNDESLADQAGSAGTDADAAIFFSDEGGRREVLLIETKLIERGFSVCGSYAKKALCKKRCASVGFHDDLVRRRATDEAGRPLCGYTRYANWRLTQSSRAIASMAIQTAAACPFRGSGQQLWRNMLLAENVARARALDEFAFAVISPRENTQLWYEGRTDVEQEFRRVLTPFGSERFRRVALEDAVETLRPIVRGTMEAPWLDAFAEKYMLPAHSRVEFERAGS